MIDLGQMVVDLHQTARDILVEMEGAESLSLEFRNLADRLTALIEIKKDGLKLCKILKQRQSL